MTSPKSQVMLQSQQRLTKPQLMSQYEYLFKLIMIGDSNVGKSCLLLRFIEGRFKNQHQPTLGVEFGSKIININDKKVKLQLWDTAGQESFKSITRAYYKGSIGALLVFDLSSQSSFKNVKNWLYELKGNSHQKIKIALIGNKCDLEGDREVSNEEIQQFVKENRIQKYYETSALRGINVEAPFEQMGKTVLKSIDKKQIDPQSESSIGIKLNSKKRRDPYTRITIRPELDKPKEKENCAC